MAFLSLVILSCFSVSKTAANSFSITDKIYDSWWRQDSGSAIARIKTGNTGEDFLWGGPSKYDEIRYTQNCIRRCMQNPACASSQLRWSSRNGYICFLLPRNLCEDPTTPFSPAVPGFTAGDFRSFDKISDTSVPRSCQQNCYVQNPGNCSACNRPGCTGPDCKSCSQSCAACNSNYYPNSTASDNECILWTGNPPTFQMNPVGCNGDRMLLYRQFNFPNGTSIKTVRNDRAFAFGPCYNFVNTTGHNLYVELYPEDSSLPPYTATYSGFYCYNKRNISVGAFVSGTAGDGLGAPLGITPFNDDSFATYCGPFWNISSNNNDLGSTTLAVTTDNTMTMDSTVMSASDSTMAMAGTTATLAPTTPFGQGPCPGGLTAWFGTPATVNGTFQSGIAWAGLPGVKLVGVKVYMY